MFTPTTVMFIPFLAIGVILIIASLFMRKKSKSSDDEISDETITVALNQQIEKSISDADNAMEQLNRMSSMILDELENKYKELLFLYQLIDDKRIEVDNLMNETVRLNEIVQNSQMMLPTYLAAPGVSDSRNNGTYYENQPAYSAGQANMQTDTYSNPKYINKADSPSTDNKDAKVAGEDLFDSDLSVESNDSANTVDLKFSSERLPPQYADKYKDILQLIKEGMTPVEIAQRLNMGQGEVKLILTQARVRQG